jgi:hypothetical protein
MSDLLTYSIMRNDNKEKISLPSINQLPTIFPSNHIVLPPLNFDKLTEQNLSYNNRYGDYNNQARGLGLLNSAINLSTYTSNSPPSLTSSSSISSSPLNSPKLSNTVSSPSPSRSHSCDESTTTESEATSVPRRQRLGPSCDSCRQRKVKCNADVCILTKDCTTVNPQEYNLTQQQFASLENGLTQEVDGFTFVISNNKLIKFKSCKSCNLKGLSCCFSKGFTKEDIMLNNKKSCKSKVTKTTPTKIIKKPIQTPVQSSNEKFTISSLTSALEKTYKVDASMTRKSSCNNCRKRKVKCSFNDLLNKCEGCYKKGMDCGFDRK